MRKVSNIPREGDVNCNLPTLSEYAKSIAEFSNKEILPLVSEMDMKAEMDKSLVKSLFESKIMSIEIPVEYGGLGYSFAHTITAIEEISKVDPGVAVFVDVHNTLVIGAINKWGTNAQKQYYLPKLANNIVGAFSLTEHHAGSDAYSLSCEARKHHNGYLITGKKHWATNAREAGIFILMANVLGEDSIPHLTAFIIDDTLCIPTVFIAYTGEALDYKAPLLKSLYRKRTYWEESVLENASYWNFLRMAGLELRHKCSVWHRGHFILQVSIRRKENSLVK